MMNLSGTPTNNRAEFYGNLKKKLEEQHDFPTLYMFKFIVPNELEKEAQLMGIFQKEESEFSSRESKTGRYISLTIKAVMVDAQSVISAYQKAEKIEGIVSL